MAVGVVFMKKAISIFVVILFSVTLIPPTSFEEDNQFLFKQGISESPENTYLTFTQKSSRNLVNFSNSGGSCGLFESGEIGCDGLNASDSLEKYRLYNWGRGVSSYVENNSGPLFSQVAFTDYGLCAITFLNKVKCTGGNSYGQLGNGGGPSKYASMVEPSLPAGYQAIEIATLKNSYCVLLSIGDIYCWGDNSIKQVSASCNSCLPQKVTNDSLFSEQPTFTSISSSGVELYSNPFSRVIAPNGYSFITENNSILFQGCDRMYLACSWINPSEWTGNYSSDQIPTGATIYSYPDVLENHSITQSVGQCLLLDNHRVTCAGDNTGGLGTNNSSTNAWSLQNFGEYLNFPNDALVMKLIISPDMTYCAILDDQSVYCWGTDLVYGINYYPEKISYPSEWFDIIDIGFWGSTLVLKTSINAYYTFNNVDGDLVGSFYRNPYNSNPNSIVASINEQIDAIFWIDAMVDANPNNITYNIDLPAGLYLNTTDYPRITGIPTISSLAGDYSFNITIDGIHYQGTYPFIIEGDLDGDGIGDYTDTDIDGDGVLNTADDCPDEYGVSVYIQTGCSDGDLDGYPDVNDQFPFDNSQHRDSDSDGFGDNVNGTNGDSCSAEYGRSLFGGIFGCWDSDNDGWADSIDQFSDDSSQWNDSDGDGFGDNLFGRNGDFCPNESGTSLINYLGCLDSDSDGYADVIDDFPQNNLIWSDEDGDGVDDDSDTFPFDIGQWADRDGDGYGDNPYGGSTSDAFPDEATQWSDIDGDGYGDNPNGFNGDAFIADPTQWSDADGDGFGDNPSGRLADAFTDDSTQWEDQDEDGFGDNQSGNNPDPYLFDFDNDGYNDSIDPFPKFASPGDKDNDGVLDGEDLFPDDFREWADNDGDGEGDNADTDDDNDGWSDQDELRAGSDPFSSSDEPIESFEIIVPGTNVGLGAWDLIGIFGGVPLMVWIGFGFITRNSRTQMFEERLREANSRDELEEIAKKWEYSLMLRMLGPHQGIRLERLRSELDDNFESQNQSLSSIDQRVDQTNLVEEEMANQPKIVPEISTTPPIDAEGIQDDNGYEWTSTQDGKDWYRMSGSSDKWIEFSK